MPTTWQLQLLGVDGACSPLLSGWWRRANFLWAFLISASEASLLTPARARSQQASRKCCSRTLCLSSHSLVTVLLPMILPAVAYITIG